MSSADCIEPQGSDLVDAARAVRKPRSAVGPLLKMGAAIKRGGGEPLPLVRRDGPRGRAA